MKLRVVLFVVSLVVFLGAAGAHENMMAKLRGAFDKADTQKAEQSNRG